MRTRVFDGHSAAVYAVAPSPDLRWLATGSADQTVRLWTLAGCDTLAPLGAELLRRPDGSVVVGAVTPWGFADVGDVRTGDVVQMYALAGVPLTAADFFNRYANSPPNIRVEFQVRRARAGQADQVLFVGTSKRDRPVLSLFVALDREWVLWMPRGYYDTSVAGDSQFLGWQVNRATLGGPPIPTDYFPIRTHEQALRQPKFKPDNIIDRLLTTANEALAMGNQPPVEIPTVVLTDQPPRVEPVVGVGAGAIQTADGNVIAAGLPLPELVRVAPGGFSLNWRVEPRPGKALGPFELRVDGQIFLAAGAPPVVDPVSGVATVPMRYNLAPGTYTLSALANKGGLEREKTVVVTVDGPSLPTPSRLKILAIAPAFADARFPAINLIEDDARAMKRFFERYAVTPAGDPFPKNDPPARVFVGPTSTAKNVLQALDDAASGPIQQGDLAVVLIESHVLNLGSATSVIASDTQANPIQGGIPAEAISTALESLVSRGCKVLVVLDGVHPTQAKDVGGQADVVEWVRQLRNQHYVITAVASTRGPVEIKGAGNRPLAQAILDAPQKAPRRPTKTPNDDRALITLADLRQAVVERVQALTAQRGEPQFYIPTGINAGLPILGRKPQ